MFKAAKLQLIFECLLLIFLSTCGLEEIAYLPPPVFVSTDAVANTFVFKITHEHGLQEQYFRGIELYYKFYQEGNTNFDLNINSVEELRTKGFYRIASNVETSTDINKPLIGISTTQRTALKADVNAEIVITLDFADIDFPDKEPTATGSGTNVQLRREANTYPEDLPQTAETDKNLFKRFSDMSTSDLDLKFLEGSGVINNVQLVIYAVSYGMQDIATPIHSRPTYLSSLVIPFTQQ
jgi:hypothetical protein